MGEVGSGNALPPLPSPATALPNFGQCLTTKSIFYKKSDFAQIIIDFVTRTSSNIEGGLKEVFDEGKTAESAGFAPADLGVGKGYRVGGKGLHLGQ